MRDDPRQIWRTVVARAHVLRHSLHYRKRISAIEQIIPLPPSVNRGKKLECLIDAAVFILSLLQEVTQRLEVSWPKFRHSSSGQRLIEYPLTQDRPRSAAIRRHVFDSRSPVFGEKALAQFGERKLVSTGNRWR